MNVLSGGTALTTTVNSAAWGLIRVPITAINLIT